MDKVDGIVKSDARTFLYEVQAQRNDGIPTVLRDRKNVLDLKIVILLDISGSISLETYKGFMGILDNIKGMSMVRVIEFSSKVHSMYDYFKTNQNEVMRLKGGGGTLFVPAFEAGMKLKPDTIIIMTDGENFDHVEKPSVPVGLVLVNGGKHGYNWMKLIGTVTNKRLDKEENKLKFDEDKDLESMKDFLEED